MANIRRRLATGSLRSLTDTKVWGGPATGRSVLHLRGRDRTARPRIRDRGTDSDIPALRLSQALARRVSAAPHAFVGGHPRTIDSVSPPAPRAPASPSESALTSRSRGPPFRLLRAWHIVCRGERACRPAEIARRGEAGSSGDLIVAMDQELSRSPGRCGGRRRRHGGAAGLDPPAVGRDRPDGALSAGGTRPHPRGARMSCCRTSGCRAGTGTSSPPACARCPGPQGRLPWLPLPRTANRAVGAELLRPASRSSW